MSRRSSIWVVSVLTGFALLVPRPAAAIVYRGLVHTPLGATTLALSDTVLLVSGMGPSGSDGLSISLPSGCINVAALFDSIRVGTNGLFTANFFNGANLLAYGSAQKLPSDSTELLAGFDGLSDTSTVRVSAYLGGSLVRSVLVHPTIPSSSPNVSKPQFQPDQTTIIPLIILGCVVVGILSDTREDHIHLPSDPPGYYSASTHYTFLGYGLASHPAHGHLAGDVANISFDELVISPVQEFNQFNAISQVSLTGHDVSAFKIGQEYAITAPVTLPGLRALGGRIAFALLLLTGAWSLWSRRASQRARDSRA